MDYNERMLIKTPNTMSVEVGEKKIEGRQSKQASIQEVLYSLS